MGYRSEVKYIIKDVTNSGKLRDYLSYLILKNDSDFEEVLNDLKISKDYNYIFYENDSIKWESTYTYVANHIKLLTFDFDSYFNSDSEIIFISYFIRIGEDYSDVEIESYNSIQKPLENYNYFIREELNNSLDKLYNILNFYRAVDVVLPENLEFEKFGKIK